MEKFCYRCGALEKEKGPLIEGLCTECYLSENRLVKTPDDLVLEFCKNCRGYLLNNSFHDILVDPRSEYLEAAKELVSSEIEVLQESAEGIRFEDFEDSEGVDISFDAEYTSPNTIIVSLEVWAKFFNTDKPLHDEDKVKVRLSKTTCDVCKKQKTGYYEALLQVRGENEIPEENLKRIFKNLEGRFQKVYGKNRKEFVSKIQQKHGGLDLYTSSAEVAKELGRFLKNTYGAELDESAELVGETDDGQRKYRVTVLARIPS